jgi:hypothetical protein
MPEEGKTYISKILITGNLDDKLIGLIGPRTTIPI